MTSRSTSLESSQPRPYDAEGFRYTTRPFPAYRHLPGVTPHPRRHPSGHHFGEKELSVDPFDATRWQFSEEYLYGVDLYNFAYFWEAHESWEALWKTTGGGDLSGLFLQGLIQISAALLKRQQHILRGMRNLSRQGLDHLRTVMEAHRSYCGLELEDFTERMQRLFASDWSRWTEDPRIYLAGLRPVSN
ncbi:MAG TPA: DUF309 domain-containing protein [Acidobacteriota bacterium]|jgi:hypothetical protein